MIHTTFVPMHTNPFVPILLCFFVFVGLVDFFSWILSLPPSEKRTPKPSAEQHQEQGEQ
jgi:hypothetical protein